MMILEIGFVLFCMMWLIAMFVIGFISFIQVLVVIIEEHYG